MLNERSTLAQFLTEQRRKNPESSGDVHSLILDVAVACKALSQRISTGSLTGIIGAAGAVNVQGEQQQKLDVLANDWFINATESSGHVAGMVSEELDTPYTLRSEYARGDYLLVFDPLDGSSNIDVNLSVGSIFSILPAPRPGEDPEPGDYLQRGRRQVAAGYAIYGPSTRLILTVGDGVQEFTLDPGMGEFFLTREKVTIAPSTQEYAINASNERFWEPAVQRYVNECLQGTEGPREKNFNTRWIASLVAEAHRILTRGGVFLYPTDNKEPKMPGRLRLLYEANPVSFIVEQAGGLGSTGRERVLDIEPEDIHQRVGFVFGCAEEVERIERYHAEPADSEENYPLFGNRGLFRGTDG